MSILAHPLESNPLKTREDLANGLRAMLDPLAAFTSPGGAQIHLGATATHFDTTAAALEGFSRPLWGLSSLLAGGGPYGGVERWIKGFEAGTDPSNAKEFWGVTRGKDQRMVEMAAIGFTLAVAKEQIWDKMSDIGKDNLTAWLGGINDKDMPNTNWLWFRVFANLGLRSVGRPYSQSQLTADLDHLDTFLHRRWMVTRRTTRCSATGLLFLFLCHSFRAACIFQTRGQGGPGAMRRLS